MGAPPPLKAARGCMAWSGSDRSSLFVPLVFAVLGFGAPAPAKGPANSSPWTLPAAPPGCIDHLAPPVIVDGEAMTRTAVKARMAELHIPGMSMAYIHDGRIAWTRQFGLARKGHRVGPLTLFQAGSISKPLTALAVLKLVQEGKLDLDVDVNRYLKRWKVPDNALTAKTKVTLRMLLNHTSGLVRGGGFYARDVPAATVVQELNGEAPATSPKILVTIPPGTTWRYSNGAFGAIQVLLEDVTGRPFAQYMQEAVLGPLGMTHSTFTQPLPRARLPKAAYGHNAKGTLMPGTPHSIALEAAEGLWSTAADLGRYAVEVQATLAGQGGHVIGQAMTRQMLAEGLGHYGLGIGLTGGPQNPIFTHEGGTLGYLSHLAAYEHGDGVVILTNGERGEEIFPDLERTLAYAAGWPDGQPLEVGAVVQLEPRALEAFVGQYLDSQDEVDFNVTLREGKLYSRATGTPRRSLEALDGHRFFCRGTGVIYVFSDVKNSKARTLTSNLDGIWTLKAERFADTDYRRAESGAVFPALRIYLNPDASANVASVWCDSAKGGSLTSRLGRDRVEFCFDSGTGWGCGGNFRCNVVPLGKNGDADLRGYNVVKFRLKAPKDLAFVLHMTESGSAKGSPATYHGEDGADGESFVSPPLTGAGQWKDYDVDLADMTRRPEWGNQAGNRILDLQAIESMDFAVGGGQGKAVLAVKSVELAVQ